MQSTSPIITSSQYTLLLQYTTSQYHKTKRLLSFCTFFLLITNLLLIVSYFYIKHLLSSLLQENHHLHLLLSENSFNASTKTHQINKRLVNLYSHSILSKLYLTDIFTSKYELDFIMNAINTKMNTTSLKLALCYQGKVDGDIPDKFIQNCVSNKMMVVLETERGNRFGGFTSNSQCGELKRSYMFQRDPNAFLFTLNRCSNTSSECNVSLFNVNNMYEHRAYKLDLKGFFIFGEKDLMINAHYKNGYSCYSMFPKCYGNTNNNTLNDYTNGEREFTIREMEIYSIT